MEVEGARDGGSGTRRYLVGLAGLRYRGGEDEAEDRRREGEEIYSTKPVLVGADPGNGYIDKRTLYSVEGKIAVYSYGKKNVT